MTDQAYVAEYEFATENLRLADQSPVRAQARGLPSGAIEIRQSDRGFRVVLTLLSSTPERAASVADAYASRLRRYLTLYFAGQLSGAIAVQRRQNVVLAPQGRAGDQSVDHLIPVPAGELVFVTDTVRAVLTTSLSGPQIEKPVSDCDLQIAAGRPVTAADLETAQEMAMAGLQSDNCVVRFLGLYSALMLLAIFKGGEGKQASVDRLLNEDDPPAPYHTVLRRGEPKLETIYTMARNTLIHPEERGKDLRAALAGIERLAADFQTRACRILLKG